VTKRIGVIGPSRSPRTIAARAALVAAGAEVHVFDSDLPEGEEVTLSAEGACWNGVLLNELDAVLVIGFRYQDPVLPPADPEADWSLWRCEHTRAVQTFSFLHSLLSRLEAGPVRSLNPVSAYLGAFSRFSDLRRWAGLGIKVPELLCTNDPDAAIEAERDWGPPVWHPAVGRGAWQLFRERQRADLLGSGKPPILLAAVPDGPLVRVLMCEGAVMLSLISASPTDEGLERFELFKVAHADDLGLTTIARILADNGVPWAGVQCVMTSGGPVLFEIDPDPVLNDLPPELARVGWERTAARLVGAPLPPLDEETIHERPTLFQRRMLRVQFDIERSKSLPV